MREQLIHYVELLFAGAPEAYEIRQEILQNTLDRYDDLIAQGKAPEAAYRLAISGIGDINEILGNSTSKTAPAHSPVAAADHAPKAVPVWRKVLRAIAIALYILCPVPLFILQDEAGLCGLLIFVAIATALSVIAGSNKERPVQTAPVSEGRKVARGIIWSCGIALFICATLITEAWYITWLIFPLCACVQGLISACMDLKEACSK